MAGESINDLEKRYYEESLAGTLPGGGGPLSDYSIATVSITHPSPAYTVAVTGTGNNDLNPVNGGYVTLVDGYAEGINKGSAFTVLADGRIQMNLAGTYVADAYADIEHSSNNSTVGAVFSIERGGMEVYTPRSVHSKLPNVGDVGNLSGNGAVDLLVGDILGIALASDVTGSVSVRASTLSVQYLGELT